MRWARSAALGLLFVLSTGPALAEPYLDDRSTPERVIASLYNALNAADYARAWSYYAEDAHPLSAYSSFIDGYASTASVQLRTGVAISEAGMSQVLSGVPMSLRSTEKNGEVQYFSGCYLLLQFAPGVQDPPFRPIEIIGSRIRKVSGPVGTALPTDCTPESIPRYRR